MAIINDFNELTPTIGDANINAAGPGIEGIFQQFFNHRRRAFDHLAGGDLVGDAIIELPDERGSDCAIGSMIGGRQNCQSSSRPRCSAISS